jgi:chromosome segregation ATPase
MCDTLLETFLSSAPNVQVEQLDALRAALHRLEATEARLQRRARTLSEQLLAAERRIAGLLPAEEEIKGLREEVARLAAEGARLTAESAVEPRAGRPGRAFDRRGRAPTAERARRSLTTRV